MQASISSLAGRTYVWWSQSSPLRLRYEFGLIELFMLTPLDRRVHVKRKEIDPCGDVTFKA